MSDPDGKGRDGGEGGHAGSGGGSRASIAALVVIAILVLAGYFLAQKLKSTSELQDCVMSGRTNCAPIAAPQH